MFSKNLYLQLNLKTQEEKDEFDNMFFKSIGLYQGVFKFVNKDNSKEIMIFRNKNLNTSIRDSLMKYYNCEEHIFKHLFFELSSILGTKHLKLGEIGILKKNGDDIYLMTA